MSPFFLGFWRRGMFIPFSMILLVVSQVPVRPSAAAAPFAETGHRVALETLVQNPDILAALKVNQDAKANLQTLRIERADQANRVRRLVELAPGPDRSKLLAEIIAAPATSPRKVAETLKQILSIQQFTRLKQIYRQILGPSVVFEAADKLGLTPDQHSRLRAISRVESQKAAIEGKAEVEIRQQHFAEIRKALTTQQQQILDDLLGPPSEVSLKGLGSNREFGRANPPSSFWNSSQRSPVIYLGLPEVRSWLELANWSDIENLLVEENDIDAVLAFTINRLPSVEAESLANRALVVRNERMSRLEEAVFRLMSTHQATRLKNLKYQANNSAPYSWPTADLLGVTKEQRSDYNKALRREVFGSKPQKRLVQFDHFRFLTPEQRKKWDELRGEPVPSPLLRLCPAVKDSRWRPQLREGLAAKLPSE
jgi:hypothetical protein